MFRRTVIRHGACLESDSPVYIPCLVLIALLATSALLHAASEPDSSTIRLIPVRAVGSTAPSDAPSTARLCGADGPVRLAAPDLGDKIADPYKPESIPIGRGYPDLKGTPGTLAAVGLLAIPLDNTLARIFPGTPSDRESDGLTDAVNKLGSRSLLLTAVGGMYVLGNTDDKETAKLAFAALANAAVATEGLKLLSGRARPGVSHGLTRFRGPGVSGDGYRSFPSGHTSGAFAVATVLANRHPKQKWLYYGLAAAVGLARIRKSAHFPSDVLVGAAIGIQAGNNTLRHGPRIFSVKL